MNLFRSLALAGALAGALALPSLAQASPPEDDLSPTERFEARLYAWQLDEARELLDELEEGPERDAYAGALAHFEADYATAEAKLSAVVAADDVDASVADMAEHFLSLARGAQKVLGESVTVRSEDGRFEVAFVNGKDELLAPYLFDALGDAYDALGDELGVRPEPPVRFELLDDASELSLVTPLGLDAVYTTGTVGITKYNRVMMVTPRVMLYGYGWLDTAVHEYVHVLVTLRTENRAPVWMQEGLAKLFETRWRTGELPELDEPVAALLHEALTRDELVTLEEMHPSVAMLPSAELAALAYAEVQTMLQLLYERKGAAGLGDLMDAVAEGTDAKEALAQAWGASFDDFWAEWKRVTKTRTARARAGEIDRVQFTEEGEEAAPEDPSLLGDVFGHLGGGKGRQHARLGVLLTLRGHRQAAVIEYEKARQADARVRRDPRLARRLGELYLELDEPARALPLLQLAGADDPENPNLAAAEGRALLRTGDRDGARKAFDRALRQNPFIPALHCDLAELAEDEQTRKRELLHCRE